MLLGSARDVVVGYNATSGLATDRFAFDHTHLATSSFASLGRVTDDPASPATGVYDESIASAELGAHGESTVRAYIGRWGVANVVVHHTLAGSTSTQVVVPDGSSGVVTRVIVTTGHFISAASQPLDEVAYTSVDASGALTSRIYQADGSGGLNPTPIATWRAAGPLAPSRSAAPVNSADASRPLVAATAAKLTGNPDQDELVVAWMVSDGTVRVFAMQYAPATTQAAPITLVNLHLLASVPVKPSTVPTKLDLAAGDFNGTGQQQLALAVESGSAVDATILNYDANNLTFVPTTQQRIVSGTPRAFSMTAGNLGGHDALVTGQDNQSSLGSNFDVFVWSADLSSRNGYWGSPVASATTSSSLAIGDLNADGTNEIVLAYKTLSHASDPAAIRVQELNADVTAPSFQVQHSAHGLVFVPVYSMLPLSSIAEFDSSAQSAGEVHLTLPDWSNYDIWGDLQTAADGTPACLTVDKNLISNAMVPPPYWPQIQAQSGGYSALQVVHASSDGSGGGITTKGSTSINGYVGGGLNIEAPLPDIAKFEAAARLNYEHSSTHAQTTESSTALQINQIAISRSSTNSVTSSAIEDQCFFYVLHSAQSSGDAGRSSICNPVPGNSQTHQTQGTDDWNATYANVQGSGGVTQPTQQWVPFEPDWQSLTFAGATASMSSTASSSPAHSAAVGIDGEIEETPANYASTSAEANAWWQTDLGSSQPVNVVRVYNRDLASCPSSGCPDALQDFTVSVIDPGTSKIPANPSDLQKWAPCRAASAAYTLQSVSYPAVVHTTPCATTVSFVGVAGHVASLVFLDPTNHLPLTAQVVRVQRQTPGALSLSEVQVFGATDSVPVNPDRYPLAVRVGGASWYEAKLWNPVAKTESWIHMRGALRWDTTNMTDGPPPGTPSTQLVLPDTQLVLTDQSSLAGQFPNLPPVNEGQLIGRGDTNYSGTSYEVYQSWTATESYVKGYTNSGGISVDLSATIGIVTAKVGGGFSVGGGQDTSTTGTHVVTKGTEFAGARGGFPTTKSGHNVFYPSQCNYLYQPYAYTVQDQSNAGIGQSYVVQAYTVPDAGANGMNRLDPSVDLTDCRIGHFRSNPTDTARPIANNDTASTPAGTPVTVDVLKNDTDTDAEDIYQYLHVGSYTQAAHGTVTQNGEKLTYTPNPGFSGTDTFTYIASDGTLYSANPATVTVTVTPTVTGVPDNALVQPVGTTDINVLANDTSTVHGHLSITRVVTQPTAGSVAVSPDGSKLIYTAPAAGDVGSVTFSYAVTDGTSTVSDVPVTVSFYTPNLFAPVQAKNLAAANAGSVSMAPDGKSINVQPGATVTYGRFDFGAGLKDMTLRYATAGTVGQGNVQVRADSATGPVVATFTLGGTNGQWTTLTNPATWSGVGPHVLYVTNSASQPVSLAWFDGNQIDLQWFASMTTDLAAGPPGCFTTVAGHIAIGCLIQGTYLDMGTVDFKPQALTMGLQPSLTYSSNSSGQVQVILDNSSVIATIPISPTGSATTMAVALGSVFVNVYGRHRVGLHVSLLTNSLGATATPVLTTGSLTFQNVTAAATTVTIATDDNLSAQPFGTTTLNVLQNDSSLIPNSTLSVKSVTQPAAGSVKVASDGKSVLYTPPAGGDVGASVGFTYVATDGKNDSLPAQVAVAVQTPNPYRAFEAENFASKSGPASVSANALSSGGSVLTVGDGAVIQYGRFDFGAKGPDKVTLTGGFAGQRGAVVAVHLDSPTATPLATVPIVASGPSTVPITGTWNPTGGTVHTIYLTVSAINPGDTATVDTLAFEQAPVPFTGQTLAREATGTSGCLQPVAGSPGVTTLSCLPAGAVLDMGQIDFSAATATNGFQMRYQLPAGSVMAKVVLDKPSNAPTWTITASGTTQPDHTIPFATANSIGASGRVTGIHHVYLELSDTTAGTTVPTLVLNYLQGV
ncbi:MAG: Ig-like domain-containing protein [Actinomycetota bacterium]|nr:Ig-like domain-containing protein [Actinomycetota bacterium]